MRKKIFEPRNKTIEGSIVDRCLNHASHEIDRCVCSFILIKFKFLLNCGNKSSMDVFITCDMSENLNLNLLWGFWRMGNRGIFVKYVTG